MYTEWIRELAAEEVCDEGAVDPAQLVEDAMLSRQKGMTEGIARGDSAIQQYYDDATILVTGGSGFLGKQLVEKLFRACNIKRMYLLLRPKRGMNVQDRLKDILQDPVYSILLQQQPTFAARIVCLQGDVAETRLGLCDQHWNTIADEVDMIFHVAATTKFDESLRVATLINVRGTREALRLGHHCKKLRSFVYVSTAYSHATSDKIGQPVLEQFYRAPVPPSTLIQLVESVDTRVLEEMAPKLTAGWPNTYTFAKAVAEEQVRLTAGELPICIVRPSIVISAHHEPAPGWLDISSARSASAFVVGSGLGLLHVMQTTPTTDVSLVPVDYVNNAIIAAGWEVGTRRHESEAAELLRVRRHESEAVVLEGAKQCESEAAVLEGARQSESEAAELLRMRRHESEAAVLEGARQCESEAAEVLRVRRHESEAAVLEGATQSESEAAGLVRVRRHESEATVLEEATQSESEAAGLVRVRRHEGEAAGLVGAREHENKTKIYNVVMSQENKLTWELLRSYCMEIRNELPMPSAIYLAYVFCVRSYYAFLLLTVLLHFVPACAADAVLLVMGQERKFLRIYKKIFKLSVSLSYFLNTTYYLNGENTEKLFDKLSPVDKKIFFFNMRTIDWYEFSQVWCIGVRKYIVKDGLKNTEKAKRKQFWFKYINYVILSLYVCVLWYVISNFFMVLVRVFC